MTPQIDHRHPEVRKDLLAWGAWVLQVCNSASIWPDNGSLNGLQTTGAMGFRLDAIKHMDRRFLLDFVSILDIPDIPSAHRPSSDAISFRSNTLERWMVGRICSQWWNTGQRSKLSSTAWSFPASTHVSMLVSNSSSRTYGPLKV